MDKLTNTQKEKLKKKLLGETSYVKIINTYSINIIPEEDIKKLQLYNYTQDIENKLKNIDIGSMNLNFNLHSRLLPDYDIIKKEINVLKTMQDKINADIESKQEYIEDIEERIETNSLTDKDDRFNKIIEVINNNKENIKKMKKDIESLEKGVTDKQLIIDGNLYPSVNYYVMLKLYSLLPEYKFNINDTYRHKGINRSLFSIKNDYIYDREQSISKMLRKNFDICMLEKFKDIYAQEILKLTDKKKLVYNFPYYSFSKNYIGQELQKYRKIVLENPSYVYGLVTSKNSDKLIQSDVFIREWITLRIKDFYDNILRVFTIFQLKKTIVFNEKSKDNINLISKLVLKYLYNPVNLISINSINLEKIKVPDYFETLCDNSTSKLNKTDEVVKFTYIYIISLINYISTYTENNVDKLKKVIFNSQLNMNEGPNCNITINDKFDSNILNKKAFKCLIQTYKNLLLIFSKMQFDLNTENPDEKYFVNEYNNLDFILIEHIILNVNTDNLPQSISSSDNIWKYRNYPVLDNTDEIKIKKFLNDVYTTTVTNNNYIDLLKSITVVAKSDYKYKTNHINYYSNID
jgi:hypothetical protein